MTPAEFDEATEIFDDLRNTDPYRVDDIDVFSNILYVSEKQAELAALATEYVKVDRNRPEVCCLIGEIGMTSACHYALAQTSVLSRQLLLIATRTRESHHLLSSSAQT